MLSSSTVLLVRYPKLYFEYIKQDIAFLIPESYLMDSFERSLLQLNPGKPLRMHISEEVGTGKSRVVEALKYLSYSWGNLMQ